ncbi:putative STE/STE11 serine/threonine-protein kinase [Trypanosoma cruzi]|nr:putative STE/STE11 serine/threonine-protein kinase [Trypanosoma cruzi]
MSDVFYLNIPRGRVPRGVSGAASAAPTVSLHDPLSRAVSPASSNARWGVVPMVVGVLSVGCAFSLAVRLWQYRQQCLSSIMSGGGRVLRGEGGKPQLRRRPRRCSSLLHNARRDDTPLSQKEPLRLTTDESIPSPTAHLPEANDGCFDDDNRTNGLEWHSLDHQGEAGDEDFDTRTSSLNSPLMFVTTTGERYKRVSQLGRGGCGRVYKCFNLNTGQVVAVKEVRLEESTDGDRAEELRSEFELLSRVSHPNIIRVIGCHVGKQHARLFLEWAAGGSLCDVMKAIDRSFASGLHEDLVQSYVRQILEALQCLHENGIIHRDLKPQNLLIDHAGKLRVTDFGLSRLVAEGASAVETVVAGTPRYLAPEAISAGRFSCGSDLWAVGATMSELFTGRPPWSHLGVQQLPSLLYHIANNPEDHPVIPAHISEEAKEFMAQCFRPEPGDRGTAAILLQHPFLTGERRE